MTSISRCWGIFLGACLAAGGASAADKALLVGIGDYAYLKNANLPGITTDIDAMRTVALAAGFDDENIIVLMDRDATLRNFRIVFGRELKNDTSADDRVLIYFSGHGTQVKDKNKDERDGSDEALMMYDTRKRYSRGEARLEYVLLDDEIEDMLADIPSKNVVVLVDACHSGTVTRYLDLDEDAYQGHVPKTFLYDGMPEPSEYTSRAIDDSDARQYNYVALTASRDDQLAIATPEGSIFTRALSAIVDGAKQNGSNLTLEDLYNAVGREIHNMVAPERLFNPQLSGDTGRAARTIIVNQSR